MVNKIQKKIRLRPRRTEMAHPPRDTTAIGQSDKQLNTFVKIRDLSAAVASGSLLVGVSWLTGKCWPLGFGSLEYLTVYDVANNALMACPLMVLGTILIYITLIGFPAIPDFLYKDTHTLITQKRSFKFKFLIFSLLFLIFHLIYPDKSFYMIIPIFGLYVGTAVWDFAWNLYKAKIITWEFNLLVRALSACFVTATLSASVTGTVLYDLDSEPTEYVCVAADCKDATIITRLNEVTYLRWDKETRLSVIPNSQILSVTVKRNLRKTPPLDLRAWVKKLWH